MAENEELRKPRKKKGSKNIPHEAPFPIPFESLTGKPASEKRWYRYFGKLRGDKVVVDRFGDMTFLYKMGFFGKGCLSKSDPRFSQLGNTFDDRCRHNFINRSSKSLTNEERMKRIRSFDAIHQERLKQHLSWSNLEGNSSTPLQDQAGALQETGDMVCDKGQMSSVPDNFAEDDDMDETLNKRCRLEDPFPITEFLQLTLEEAFFLVFGLGCLTLLDENEERITIPELWKTFCKLKPRFVETYTVYHYFRSKGWVVRDGIVYGSDFLLYKEGMPFYHSSYAVFSYMVENGEIGNTLDSLPWNWQYLSCINRVAEHVAKEVLLCLVIKPERISKEELNSPKCLTQLEVQELLLRRWVPEKHRESKKESKSK